MPMPDDDDDLRLYRLTSVRTCGIRDDPDRAALQDSMQDHDPRNLLRVYRRAAKLSVSATDAERSIISMIHLLDARHIQP